MLSDVHVKCSFCQSCAVIYKQMPKIIISLCDDHYISIKGFEMYTDHILNAINLAPEVTKEVAIINGVMVD